MKTQILKKAIHKIIFFFLLAISIISCNRDEDLDTKLLIGDWNWISTTGGITGNLYDTPASTGKTIVLTFKEDNTYKITTNGTITKEGTFGLYKNVSNLDHYEKTFIDFSNDSDMMIYRNDESKLVLSDDANDGVSVEYEKK